MSSDIQINPSFQNKYEEVKLPFVNLKIPIRTRDLYFDTCFNRHWFDALNVTLLAMVIFSLFLGFRQLQNISGETEANESERIRYIVTSITSAGILGWPVLWDLTIGYGVMIRKPATIFGFLWPIVMSSIDLAFLQHTNSSVEQLNSLTSVKSGASALIGIAFAIGSLLFSQQNSVVAKTTTPLLMYALLLLIAFVIPVPNLESTSNSAIAIGSVQRLFFHYAMGYVITGITLNLSFQESASLQQLLNKSCND